MQERLQKVAAMNNTAREPSPAPQGT